MPANLEIPLDLPEIRILKSELSEQEIVIAVESTRAWAICPRCGEKTRKFHRFGRQLRLRHLPILGRPVMIEIRPRRAGHDAASRWAVEVAQRACRSPP